MQSSPCVESAWTARREGRLLEALAGFAAAAGDLSLTPFDRARTIFALVDLRLARGEVGQAEDVLTGVPVRLPDADDVPEIGRAHV